MPGELALTLDDIKKFRQIDSKTPGPSGISHDHRRGNYDRAAGTRRGQQRGHGDRRANGWLLISTSRALNYSITTSM